MDQGDLGDFPYRRLPAEATDADLIVAGFSVLAGWLRPDANLADRDALYMLISLYEQSGRSFLKADYPAND